MTIGDKSLLDDQMRDEYSISGASHILALSGLHLMVLFAIVNYIMNGIAKFLIGYTGGIYYPCRTFAQHYESRDHD